MSIKTPKLDSVFGERLHGVTHNPTPTNWPRVSERIRPLLEAWEGLVGWHPSSPVTEREWISSAYAWAEEYGIDTKVLKAAFMAAVVDIGVGRIKNMRSVMYAAAGMRNRTAIGLTPCPECSQIGGYADDRPNGE